MISRTKVKCSRTGTPQIRNVVNPPGVPALGVIFCCSKCAGLLTSIYRRCEWSPPGDQLLALGKIANPEILESHIAVAARVQLQRDTAVAALRLGVRVVDHLYSVQTRHVAVP